MPVAAISTAVARPIRSTRSPDRAAAPSPTCVREDRGAEDVVVAVDGVDAVEHRDPQPRAERGVLVAVDHRVPAGRRRSVAGAPPPPLRTDPSSRPCTPAGSTDPCSSWVIWPIFSSRVISARSAVARVSAGCDGSRQADAGREEGGPLADPPGGIDGVEVPQAPATSATVRTAPMMLRDDSSPTPGWYPAVTIRRYRPAPGLARGRGSGMGNAHRRVRPLGCRDGPATPNAPRPG